MVLVKNWTFVQLFFLGKIGREHLFGNVLDIIIAPLDHKNITIKRSQNLHFLGLVKTWPFPQLFFLGQTGREELFGNVLSRITAFLDCKNINIKPSQHLHFSKRLSR